MVYYGVVCDLQRPNNITAPYYGEICLVKEEADWKPQDTRGDYPCYHSEQYFDSKEAAIEYFELEKRSWAKDSDRITFIDKT